MKSFRCIVGNADLDLEPLMTDSCLVLSMEVNTLPLTVKEELVEG